MKRILITPQTIQLGAWDRQYSTTTLSDFLLDEGALPFMAYFHSQISSREDGAKVAEKFLEELQPDGIVLQGGDDLSPDLYGQENEHVKKELKFRDYFEFALLELALSRHIPVFGICRGMQLMNVVLGGDLHQHLHEGEWGQHIKMRDGVAGHMLERQQYHEHLVRILEGGVLSAAHGKTSLVVNSFHHQGIRTLAPHLNVEATAEDGLIEAVSSRDLGWVGVQWHPELAAVGTDLWAPLRMWLEGVKE